MIEFWIGFLVVYGVILTVAYIHEAKDCARKNISFNEMNDLWRDEVLRLISEIQELGGELDKYKRHRDPVTGRFVKVKK